GDYHVAVRRMLRVLDAVSEYEVQPDLVSRALAMMAQMRRFNMALADPGPGEMVERRTLELLVSRLIDEASLRDHPLTTDPADFWHTWMVIMKGTIHFDEAATKQVDLRLSNRSPVMRSDALPPLGIASGAGVYVVQEDASPDDMGSIGVPET